MSTRLIVYGKMNYATRSVMYSAIDVGVKSKYCAIMLGYKQFITFVSITAAKTELPLELEAFEDCA